MERTIAGSNPAITIRAAGEADAPRLEAAYRPRVVRRLWPPARGLDPAGD